MVARHRGKRTGGVRWPLGLGVGPSRMFFWNSGNYRMGFVIVGPERRRRVADH